MAFSMNLWKVENEKLKKLDRSRLSNESRLEQWLTEDLSLLELNIILIGRQVNTAYGGRIDLLGISADGELVILELKKDKTPRDIVAQVLDYASWVGSLTAKDINDIASRYLAEPLSVAFQKRFDLPLPDVLNSHHRMVIVASELDSSSERIVQYLASEYGIDINAIFFNVFKDNDKEFVGRSWLMDPEKVNERAESRISIPWSGYYFVNVGEGPHRNWEDCVQYGFISAGQGKIFSDPLKKLNVGDQIFAYMKQLGYTGYGIVTNEAVMVRDFEYLGKRLLELDIKQKGISDNQDNEELSEWVVGIDWKKTFPRDQGKWMTGFFANQNIVCKLRHQDTVEYLNKEFEVIDNPT